MARPHMDDIIKHKDTFLLFYKYLKHTHAEEALNFWVEAELYQRVTRQPDLSRRAKEIFNKYVKVGSRHEVNVDGVISIQLAESIINADKLAAWGNAQRNIFVPTQEAAIDLLSNAFLSSFLSSKEYKKYMCGSLRTTTKLPGLSKVAKRSRSQTMEVFDKYFDLLEDKTKHTPRKMDVSISSGYNISSPCLFEDPNSSPSSLKFPAKPLPPKPQQSKPLPPTPTRSRSSSNADLDEEKSSGSHQHECNKNSRDFSDPDYKSKPLPSLPAAHQIKYVRPRPISAMLATQNDAKDLERVKDIAGTPPRLRYIIPAYKQQSPPPLDESFLSSSGCEEGELDMYCCVGDGVKGLEALDIDSMAAQLAS